MEKTAVELLIQELFNNGYFPYGVPEDLVKKAKEMELNQRKNDYRAGWNDNKHKDWNCEFYLKKHLTNFETFKSE